MRKYGITFYKQANAEYEEQQNYILKQILEITCGYAAFFSEIGQLVSHLDCLVGFAVAAVTAPIPYCKPKIVDKVGTIKLVEARHPCLELLDNINFIPNSIDFDEVNYIVKYFLYHRPPTKKQGLCWALDVICVKFTACYFFLFLFLFEFWCSQTKIFQVRNAVPNIFHGSVCCC